MATSGGEHPSEGGEACFEKALELLSRRQHLRRELERKLRARRFESEDVDYALDRAAELGYLDDLECARELARVRVERRQEGPARLYATLSRRGADADTARRVVDELYADGETEPLEGAASKWLRSHPWDRDRLARHLNRKGFSTGAILSAVERLGRSESRGSDRPGSAGS